MNEVAEKIIQTTKAALVNNAYIKPVFICGLCDRPRMVQGRGVGMVRGVVVSVCNKCKAVIK